MVQILKPQLFQGTFTDSYPMDIWQFSFKKNLSVVERLIFMWYLGGDGGLVRN